MHSRTGTANLCFSTGALLPQKRLAWEIRQSGSLKPDEAPRNYELEASLCHPQEMARPEQLKTHRSSWNTQLAPARAHLDRGGTETRPRALQRLKASTPGSSRARGNHLRQRKEAKAVLMSTLNWTLYRQEMGQGKQSQDPVFYLGLCNQLKTTGVSHEE